MKCMLKRLFRKFWYRGAGVLLYRMDSDGSCKVILFKRNNNPDKHKYSITGGRMDRDDERNFRKTAERETWEETKITVEIPEYCPVLVTNLFFFKWKTYFVRYEERVDRSRFTISEIYDWIEQPISEAMKRKDLAYLMPMTLKALRRKSGKGFL